MAELPHVDTWDLSMYPERDGSNPASDRYRFEMYDRNGFIQHHKVKTFQEKAVMVDGVEVIGKVAVEETNPKRLQSKRWMVTGAGNDKNRNPVAYRWGMQAADIREAEKQIGGKPTHVQMGLWYTPEFSLDGEILAWHPVNRKEQLQPSYWRNVDEEYYAADGWRYQAYNEKDPKSGKVIPMPDPYKNQERPITRMMEMEAKMAEQEAAMKAREVELEKKAKLLESRS